MVEYHVLSHHDLPSALRWQMLSAMRIQWPGVFSGDNRLSTHVCDEELHPTYVLAEQEGVLISFATVTWRELEHAGQMLSVYGLGDVFTFPPFRGEGYARHVVARATDHIRATDGDLGCLFCEPWLEALYVRSGWEAISPGITLIGTAADRRPFEKLRMMVFLSKRGESARAALSTVPLFVGDPW